MTTLSKILKGLYTIEEKVIFLPLCVHVCVQVSLLLCCYVLRWSMTRVALGYLDYITMLPTGLKYFYTAALLNCKTLWIQRCWVIFCNSRSDNSASYNTIYSKYSKSTLLGKVRKPIALKFGCLEIRGIINGLIFTVDCYYRLCTYGFLTPNCKLV